MKADLQKIKQMCPEVPGPVADEFVARLSDEYFDRFDLAGAASHLRGLALLSPDHPVEVLLEHPTGDTVECTILAFDYPFEFSLITGTLSGMGVGILSGDIFTYERSAAPAVSSGRPFVNRDRLAKTAPRRRIIDHFSCTARLDGPREEWTAELRRRMAIVMDLLEKGGGEAAGQAKQRVNEWVTERLSAQRKSSLPVLYPVEIDTSILEGGLTRLKVVSQDTPAFLYSLSTALSLHGISIEHVRIRTHQGRIEDEIDFEYQNGQPVTDPNKLNQVKLSVLLTKQFTYYLDKAPDPYKALSRFEQMMEDILRLPERGQWLELLSNPRAMQDLARLLGASDFVWEDFIRLQYEALLPILKPHVEGHSMSQSGAALETRLREALASASNPDDQRKQLNAFKDRELYLIDLDHIMNPSKDFRLLSGRLTGLAEIIVRCSMEIVGQNLRLRHGHPRTVAGLETACSVLGLGKLGGAALGYASDIELLFVYSDDGQTDGGESITNAEYFGALAREVSRFIETKREGIFHVDLRLRPHGNSGPWASSLEGFCKYYGGGGAALSYERLALVRLRAIAGDPELGSRIERLRNDFIYASPSIDIEELQSLRLKQFEEKKRGSLYNAKFSPGALVDLEYTVQMLQVLYAGKNPALRTPRIHEALEALAQAGVLALDENDRLAAAYDFLRQLINGLRMLRGSAKDLFLPAQESDEFVHLARRMGYETRNDLKPAQQLFVDFELHTAAVRAFVEKHFGRDALPEPAMGNIADLVLSDEPPEKLRETIFSEAGFQNTARAFTNLKGLAGDGARRNLFAQLAVLAFDMLRREPDPGMALNNWERFIRSIPDPLEHFKVLLSQPRRLEILLGIFSRSQFLADTLIRHPEYLDWVTNPDNLHKNLNRASLESDLQLQSDAHPEHDSWMSALRLFRRREFLRIGARDLCLKMPMLEVTQDLSTLAESLIQSVLERVGRENGCLETLRQHFCLLAFGKLGGGELNYSSDVDLIGIYDAKDPSSCAPEMYGQYLDKIRADLTTHTEEGYVYRVDFRLRPYGGAGELVQSVENLETYYRESASLWEIQALLKLRPICGNLALGQALLGRLKPLLTQPRPAQVIVESIRQLRDAAIKNAARKSVSVIDVKSGLGGIRDIEFLVQGLQLIHASRHPEVLSGNTLESMALLKTAGLLPASLVLQLEDDYIFLRRLEHYLQIMEDRQIHRLPKDAAALDALARRMLGPEARHELFMKVLNERLERTHLAYLDGLMEAQKLDTSR
ncbi:MAG: glutamate-ammonia-ligase adenylyltransferase [Lentisphaerota bacterium]